MLPPRALNLLLQRLENRWLRLFPCLQLIRLSYNDLGSWLVKFLSLTTLIPLPLMRYRRFLKVTCEHALRVAGLPLLHKDPFDRMLIAQARSEAMLLLTVDSAVLQYTEAVLSAH